MPPMPSTNPTASTYQSACVVPAGWTCELPARKSPTVAPTARAISAAPATRVMSGIDASRAANTTIR